MDELTRALTLVRRVLTDEAASAAEVVAALEVLRHLRDELATWEPELITAARAAGASWVELAPALGVASRQAAERRYLRLRPSTSGEQTGEGRVRAERDRRAGDRAVADWARANSASLRALAGEVSAATAADNDTGAVHAALADNDPTALLSPLADAHAGLTNGDASKDDANLAARIETVTDQAERLRKDARDGQRPTGR